MASVGECQASGKAVWIPWWKQEPGSTLQSRTGTEGTCGAACSSLGDFATTSGARDPTLGYYAARPPSARPAAPFCCPGPVPTGLGVEGEGSWGTRFWVWECAALGLASLFPLRNSRLPVRLLPSCFALEWYAQLLPFFPKLTLNVPVGAQDQDCA